MREENVKTSQSGRKNKRARMKGTTLILTIAIGTEYQRLAAITHPTLHTYAKRLNADFLCIDKSQIAATTPHWEKFQIARLLDTYRRIIYLDTDILIRDDCPDLFKIVPQDTLGMFDEAPFTSRSRELLIDCCKAYGVTLDSWDGRYFNSGVIVISREHRELFTKPEEEVFNFYEQTYLNMRIAQLGIEMYALPYTLNRMTCVDHLTGEHRLASHIVHYAGAPNIQTVIRITTSDKRLWAMQKGDYIWKRHIHVIVSGGLGDQVEAEPAIRFMKAHVYPEANISVSTHYPQLFAHLDVQAHQHGEFRPQPDTPYFTIQSLPPPDSITWTVLSNLLCHTVDYCSAAILRRILPAQDKRVSLRVLEGDIRELHYMLGDIAPTTVTVIHAGRHWETKTFPLQWWQGMVDELAQQGHTVCLIGKNDDEGSDTRGIVPVIAPPGSIDLRQKLTLGQLIALLSLAPILLSNDSAPIHLAGAFENSIVLIPSCKHPEHVLPWRHGGVWWNAAACYTRLTLDDVNQQPTAIHGSSAEFEVTDWTRYLPTTQTVLESIQRLLNTSHGKRSINANICMGR